MAPRLEHVERFGGCAARTPVCIRALHRAGTDAEAERLSASVRLLGRRLRQGDLRPIATIEEAERELAVPGSAHFEEPSEWPRHVFGAPTTLRARLGDIATALCLDELMIVTIVHDHGARLRSYELLADAFDLRVER